MAVIDVLAERNADFASHRFSPDLTISPTLKTMIVGCVDPRVDPTKVLGLELGEAVVIRNVGGRVTPATLKTMVMLGVDVAVLKQTPFLPGGFLVSGLVYNVFTGLLETIVAPALLRTE